MEGCPYFDLYRARHNWSLYTRGYEYFYKVKCYVGLHRATHMSSLTILMTLH